MASQIPELEAQAKEYAKQLEATNASLHTDPTNLALLDLKNELESGVEAIESLIAELKAGEAPPRASTPPVKEKWSKENHPAFQPGYRRPGAPPELAEEAHVPTAFQVNDVVSAKWISGDKAFYPARITSITGSSADPVYTVTFKGYNNTDTIRGHDIRAIPSESKKRKADGMPATPTSPTIPTNSSVISAVANINPELALQARKEPSKVSDGPVRPAKLPKKLKGNKDLEAQKNKWQDFQTKGKTGKTTPKDSMFRTGDGVSARVGFTGSGQAMRKDPTRVRHIYQQGEDEA